MLSVVLSPVLGIVIDICGHNLLSVMIAVSLALVGHSLLAFTLLSPYIGVLFIAVAYSLCASSLWPMVPILVEERQLGTAYGNNLLRKLQRILCSSLVFPSRHHAELPEPRFGPGYPLLRRHRGQVGLPLAGNVLPGLPGGGHGLLRRPLPAGRQLRAGHPVHGSQEDAEVPAARSCRDQEDGGGSGRTNVDAGESVIVVPQ